VGTAGDTIEHVVEPGESLWSIAAQADVYADPYLWPVIYRQNRDQIVDPAQIYPQQTLVITISLDAETKARARAEAGAPRSAAP
jgi:nucleoid-associated protein YgaU